MPRKPGPETRTLTLCVTRAERDNVRAAAGVANVSVSAWCNARIVGALVGSNLRQARSDLSTMKMRPVNRGERSLRISCIVKVSDYMRLEAQTMKEQATVHSFAQAVVVRMAEREIALADPVMLHKLSHKSLEPARMPRKRLHVSLPASLAAMVDVDALSQNIGGLLDLIPSQVFEGKGPKLKSVMERTNDGTPINAGALIVELPVDFDALITASKCLILDADVLLRALALKMLGAMPARAAQVTDDGPLYVVSDEHVTDRSGNRATIASWGDVEAAKAVLASNKGCSECLDCTNCVGCHKSSRCRDSRNLVGCSACRSCENCEACRGCVGCKDCEACIGCEKCFGCKRSRNCKTSANLDGAESLVSVIAEA